MRPAPVLRALPVLALLLHPSTAACLTLDSFGEALPPNPCLPLTSQPVVFTGLYCDGASCPPDPLVPCAENFTLQTGLPGVLGGRRQVRMFNWADEPSSARIDPGNQRVQVGIGGTTETAIQLDYGTPYDFQPVPDALNPDLIALGTIALQFHLDGNISAQAPVLVAVEFLSDAPQSPRPSALALQVVEQPGPVTVLLGDFVPRLGFSMTDVDDIQVWIGNCLDFENGCEGASFTPVELAIGPVEFLIGPTPTRRASWGRVKQTYR